MLRYLGLAVATVVSTLVISNADAQQAVQCRSTNHQYNECWAGPMRQPTLVQQSSKSACILNKTWGYNPKTQYVWVGDGCSGLFADAGSAARTTVRSHSGGGEVGAVVVGTLLGAVLEGMAEDSRHHGRKVRSSGYDGCHGAGCMVDNPDEGIDTRPQFDREGNPNFDVHGNYQGCHGVGCDVDDPD